MAKSRVTITGINKTKKMFAKVIKKYPGATGAALYEEGAHIFAKTQIEVPARTGRLSASGILTPPFALLGVIWVVISYGVRYALPVHSGKRHVRFRKPGAKRRFLIDPLERAQSGFTLRLLGRIRANIRKGRGIAGIQPIKGAKQGPFGDDDGDTSR